MKIGIDARLYSPKFTGIGRYTYELVQNLAELDQENEYVIFLYQDQFKDFECPNEKWTKKITSAAHYSLAEQTSWYKQLMKEDVDLMYFPHFNVPVRYKKPFVVTIHDLTLHYYPYKEYSPKWSPKKQLQIWIYKWIMKNTLRHAEQIVAISDSTRADILKEYPKTEPSKVHTILEGVPDHFQKASEEEVKKTLDSFSISKPYFLYTGVWRSHKNLLRLIDAFSELVKEGRNIQLVLTGKKDPIYSEIPDRIKELQLEDHVVCTGFVSEEELIALNTGAKAFVFPSLYEGFGLPPLEAMRFDIPVICSNSSSLPQACGDAALYFDPLNTQELAKAMQKVLDDEPLRKELVQKGRQNLERFSWKKMSQQILDIFKNTCNYIH